jgi:predicted thioesterase
VSGAGDDVRHEVTEADTAIALGSGDVPVLATPRLVAWLEAATVEAAASSTAPGQTTVGTAVRIVHRRATFVGGTVTVEAALVGPPDGGRIRFLVRAVDATGEVVADGEIDRVLVDRERFLRKR